MVDYTQNDSEMDYMDMQDSEDMMDEEDSSNQLVIGVIGYAFDEEADDSEIDYELVSMIDDVVATYGSDDTEVIMVLCGIDSGVYAVAYDIAVERGYQTVGILTTTIMESFDLLDVDETEITDDDDSTNTFLEECDVILRVGNSEIFETEKVIALAHEYDKPTIEIDL